MIRYTYLLKDYRSWLKGFARLLQLPVIEKKMDISEEWGEGYIYASNIIPDISYFIMHVQLKHDLVLLRKKSAGFGLSLIFSQVDVSDFFKVREQQEVIVDKSPKRSNIFLSSTNYEIETTYSRFSKLKIAGILFSPAFIHKCIKKDILLDIMLYTGRRLRNVNKEPITFEYRHLLNDIFETDTQSPISNLVLQNRILLLTEKFLNTFLEKDSKSNNPAVKREKEKDILALKDVKKILSNSDLDKFPSIETLSRTAMMSSTKLKTKFKQVYGMKLYEYYNRNRLEKAKELLSSGRYSVKEVGHDIGFSNLSNFAKAFKKEFGMLPKKLIRVK